jgi:dipeptidase E
MRLYLSSFLIGDHPEKFVELISPGKRVALILNALDNRQASRDKFLVSQTETLTALGLEVEELDLRKYFDRPEELGALLQEKDAVWINGGNTFLLRRAMKQSGFDHHIKELLEKDKIVYGGFSAAVVILPPSLKGLEIVDDPIEVSEGYDPETLWDGLGLIDFAVAVHYDSDHPESALMDQEIEYYKKHNIPYQTLRDGEVIVKNGDSLEVLR